MIKLSRAKNKILIILILISLIFLLNFFQKETKNLFYLISSPIQKSFWRAGIVFSNFFERISDIQNLKKENEELKLKIDELIAENLSLKELKKENEFLKEALNLGLEKEFELKLVQVISKDISQDSLIISKGSKDGFKIGLPVITQQKCLVGKISEVYTNFSKVQLLTSKETSFDVKISEQEIYSLAKGEGNFNLSLELIPREKEIKIGDKIVTTVLGGNFPNGFLVGEIREIKKSDISPFQEAEINPAFNLQDLSTLFIVMNFSSFER